MQLTVVGDVVVSGIPRRPLTNPVRPGDSAFGLFGKEDLVIGNLEVPLTESSVPVEKLVTMRAPTSGAAELAALGFGLVSLATNHALDYGIEGLRDTIAALDAAGIPHAGGGESIQEATRPRILQLGVERLAFFSFCSTLPPSFNATSTRPGISAIRVRQSFEYDGVLLEEQPGTPPFVHTSAHQSDVCAAEELIRAAKNDCDTVVVALHWGVPWCYLPTTQGPLAQYQRPLGHRLIEAGADLIVGHHPHCLHPVEFYRHGLILYSTGNFVFDSCYGFNPNVPAGQDSGRPTSPYCDTVLTGPWYESAIFRVGLGAGGPRLKLVPIELDNENQPILACAERAAAILTSIEEESRELNSTVRIDDDGFVRP